MNKIHRTVLVGIILFIITLIINIASSAVVFRKKKRAERILS